MGLVPPTVVTVAEGRRRLACGRTYRLYLVLLDSKRDLVRMYMDNR
jgi:hypothetical protein